MGNIAMPPSTSAVAKLKSPAPVAALTLSDVTAGVGTAADAASAAAAFAAMNYAMSDHEGDSSDENEDEDGERAKKPIPDWARGPALEASIHAQYSDAGVERAESLFGAVAACDLEHIFQAKKKRYAKRTSSGVWAGDALTSRELERYRKDLAGGGTGRGGADAGAGAGQK